MSTSNQPRDICGRYTFKAAGAPVGTLDDPWGGAAPPPEPEIKIGVFEGPEPLQNFDDALGRAQLLTDNYVSLQRQIVASHVARQVPPDQVASLVGGRWVLREETEGEPTFASPELAFALDKAMNEGAEDAQRYRLDALEDLMLEDLLAGRGVRHGEQMPSDEQIAEAYDNMRHSATIALKTRLEHQLDSQDDDYAYTIISDAQGVPHIFTPDMVQQYRAFGLLDREGIEVSTHELLASFDNLAANLPGAHVNERGELTVSAGDWRQATSRTVEVGQTFLDF